MPHYKRNLRLLIFLVLPILAFLLGWTLNQKQNELGPGMSVVPTKIENSSVMDPMLERLTIPIKRRSDPRNVDLSLLWEVWNTAESTFLYQDRFDTQRQIYGLSRGLIESLDDPYTVFLDPEETAAFDESISGAFEGIGAEIGIRDDRLLVITPLKGSPSQLAGLRAGDYIFTIDGESTFGMSVTEAVTKIRGPKGEKVVLEVLRDEEPNPIEITIVRDTIQLKSLEWRMEGDIAVIEISQFGSELVREFQEALPGILLEQPRGVIIDLRNDGGGLLDACIQIADEFFGEQVIVRTNGRQIGNTEEMSSHFGGALEKMPLVVLINHGSASASEIFAGAVQDTRRGVLVGRTSFGKGSVQNVIPLSGGSSLKVTIAEWLTPNGRQIHDVGITPDIEIEYTDEDREAEKDLDLERALELFDSEEMAQILGEPAPAAEADEPMVIETPATEQALPAEDAAEPVDTPDEIE